MTFAPIEDAIAAIARGEFVVAVDDTERENEGDLILAAEKATPAAVAFMVRHTSGVICTPLIGERLDRLEIPQMVSSNTEAQRTAFTVSVDAKRGTTTGISAADRAATIRALVDPGTRPDDLTRPGHVFPLRYRAGGVLARPGHTEAAVDLTRLAALAPAGVLAELVNDDGTMARLPDLERFAAEHRLALISVADLIRHRLQRERLVQWVAAAHIPTRYGEFIAHAYRSVLDESEHLALVRGPITADQPILARVHSQCLTGDVFGSLRCDCGPQLEHALKLIAQEGRGVLVYLRRREGGGIDLAQQLRAHELRESGYDTVEAKRALGFPADLREYSIGAQILLALGVRRLRLVTNNPAKYAGLGEYGLSLVERVPLLAQPPRENTHDLRTKQEKPGHLGLG